MAKSKKKRTLAAFSMHARDSTGVIDYVEFFRKVLEFVGEDPRFGMLGEMVTISFRIRTNPPAGIGAIRFVAGSEEDPPIFFNTETGEESPVNATGGVFVRGVWSYVDAAQRIFVLETKRPGVSTIQVERFLELLGRSMGYTNLRFDLNPAPSSEFADEVEKLDRIRVASLTLRQPNYDWGDTEVEVHKYAEKSGAARVTIEMGAARGDELSAKHGIVSDIIALARKPLTSLKNVAITGRAPGDAGEKTISLLKFQKKTNVIVPVGSTASEEIESIMVSAAALAESAGAKAGPEEVGAGVDSDDLLTNPNPPEIEA